MADYRQIHVKIWGQDAWFLDLQPMEKLLFIYLFSNKYTSIAGIYELPVKVIAFETGLDLAFINEALDKFGVDGKAYYQDGVIWVVNLNRYNTSSSVKIKERIRRDVLGLPDCRLKTLYLEEIGLPDMPNKNDDKSKIKEADYKRDGRPAGSRAAQNRVRRRLIKERGEKCEKCGDCENIELHHIVPVRAGGTLDDSNVLLLCIKCHQIADVENTLKYPIYDSAKPQIPYPKPDTEQEQEQEHEIEQETEQESEQEQVPDGDESPPTASVYKLFEQATGGIVSPLEWEKLQALCLECEEHRVDLHHAAPGADILGVKWVAAAIQEMAANRPKRPCFNYVQSVIESWQHNGFMVDGRVKAGREPPGGDTRFDKSVAAGQRVKDRERAKDGDT